jgi:hypothetical protein
MSAKFLLKLSSFSLVPTLCIIKQVGQFTALSDGLNNSNKQSLQKLCPQGSILQIKG